MKNIPNFLTICNLVCGCIAITFILSAPAYMGTTDYETYYPILGANQMYIGAIFIFLAALFDVFDGLAARMLKAESPIGKDLDSLADVVSFGVAPSAIMYQLLWKSYMQEPGAMETSLWVTLPAFALAAFAALRLARFNNTASAQRQTFIGLPVPAAGIVVASLPLALLYNYEQASILENRYVLYAIIAILSFAMVSTIRFVKWKAAGTGIGAWWPQIAVAVAAVVAIPFAGFLSVAVAFVVYIVVSVLSKPVAATAVENKD